MRKLFTLFAAMLASLSTWAATPIADLNFEIKTGDTDLPSGYVYSTTNPPSIKVQNSIACVIISDGGGSAAPTFHDPAEPSDGKRWIAFCPDADCSAVFGIMSNKKVFSIYNKDGEFFKYTNTANAVEEVEVTGLKKNVWYAMCGGSSQVYIQKATFTSSCDAPAEALQLSADKTVNILAGDVITFSTTGGNGAEVKYFDGESEIANPWTATKGQHSITAVQADKDGICGATTGALELNVITNDPVTAATISAPKTQIINGEELVLTCVAENADAFQWYNGDDAIAGATQSTYTFSSDVPGDFAFHCTATNSFTASPVSSNTLNIKVTILCGELIRATHTGEKTADVTGVIGGTADKNTASDGKLGGKGKYFGIKLASGSFLEEDVLNVHTTTAAGQGTLAIYADKAGETLLFDTETPGVEGDNLIELPAELAGASTLYICRTEANTWNGYIDFISVTRSCEPGGTPTLKASANSATLKATAQEPTATAVITFSGKHLEPGTYNIVLEDPAGKLAIDPTSVTVADDGKFKQDVTITLAATADIATLLAQMTLTIGELNQSVLISYSASLTKNYATSVDFEELVINNGIGANWQAELESHNYIASNGGFSLDTLNSEKDNNNEPYLGLKIKSNNAYIGCWIHKEDTIRIKFGKVSADVKFYAGDGEPLVKTAAELTEEFEYIAGELPTYVKLMTTSADAVVIKHILVSGPAPKSSDASIKELKINGQVITPAANVYAYEVPANENLPQVEVVYELNDAKASGNPQSGFMVDVPASAEEGANQETLIVTAESGDQATYIISVTRASTQGLFDLDTAEPATKVLRNGQLLIIRGGKTYTVQGTEL